jgi:hypothetical protein
MNDAIPIFIFNPSIETNSYRLVPIEPAPQLVLNAATTTQPEEVHANMINWHPPAKDTPLAVLKSFNF